MADVLIAQGDVYKRQILSLSSQFRILTNQSVALHISLSLTNAVFDDAKNKRLTPHLDIKYFGGKVATKFQLSWYAQY